MELAYFWKLFLQHLYIYLLKSTGLPGVFHIQRKCYCTSASAEEIWTSCKLPYSHVQVNTSSRARLHHVISSFYIDIMKSFLFRAGILQMPMICSPTLWHGAYSPAERSFSPPSWIQSALCTGRWCFFYLVTTLNTLATTKQCKLIRLCLNSLHIHPRVTLPKSLLTSHLYSVPLALLHSLLLSQ